MDEIIIGTTNKAKVQQIRAALADLDVVVKGINDGLLLPEVVEDGLTAVDNARKKALAYSKALDQMVLSMDNALYIDGLKDEAQPGLHVRRVNHSHEAATDNELIEHYMKIITSLGGAATGHWEFGVCIARPNGLLVATNLKSPNRIFTTVVDSGFVPGYPLDSMQIEPISGKYFSQMRSDETDKFWQVTIGKELCDFVSSVLQSEKK